MLGGVQRKKSSIFDPDSPLFSQGMTAPEIPNFSTHCQLSVFGAFYTAENTNNGTVASIPAAVSSFFVVFISHQPNVDRQYCQKYAVYIFITSARPVELIKMFTSEWLICWVQFCAKGRIVIHAKVKLCSLPYWKCWLSNTIDFLENQLKKCTNNLYRNIKHCYIIRIRDIFCK